MDLLVNILETPSKVGVINMDKTLADYINRVTKKLEEEKPLKEPQENPNDYKVYPEEQGDADHKRNPYSPV